MTIKDKEIVGVIVARFQVADLHTGHRYLIEHALEKHEDVLIVLGCCLPRLTKADPLSFEVRRQMIHELYPQVRVERLDDHPSDDHWSITLDALVRTHYQDRSARLYCSRGSNLKTAYASAFHEVCEIEPLGEESGTAQRASAAKRIRSSFDFRAGVIYAAAQRFPTSYQTVDLAIVKPDLREVLLVRKLGSDKLWFVGGFVDPSDNSLESAAHREMREEVGFLEIHGMRYVGSTHVEDWRYRGREDGIMTAFFTAIYIFGMVKAADDVIDAVWVPHAKLEELVAESHQPLVQLFRKQYPNWTDK